MAKKDEKRKKSLLEEQKARIDALRKHECQVRYVEWKLGCGHDQRVTHCLEGYAEKHKYFYHVTDSCWSPLFGGPLVYTKNWKLFHGPDNPDLFPNFMDHQDRILLQAQLWLEEHDPKTFMGMARGMAKNILGIFKNKEEDDAY